MPTAPLHFWQVTSWLFYLLAAITTGVFLAGIYYHLSIWLKGKKRMNLKVSKPAIVSLVVDGLLGRKIFKGDPVSGIMHAGIMWGFVGLFVGTVLLTIDNWFITFLTGTVYIVYALALEIAGLMLIVGVIIALIRRYITKLARVTRTPQDLWILLLLLICAVSGFFTEGIRLAYKTPDWGPYSFLGRAFSSFMGSPAQAKSLYPFVWWFHALVSMGLIAYFPFSKLFHALAAPFNIFLDSQPEQSVSEEETGFSFRDMVSLSACTKCGRCNEVCPATLATEPLSPREFIIQAYEHTSSLYRPLKATPKEISPEQIWYCTTCMACLEVCPVYIGAFKPITSLRVSEIEDGSRIGPLITQSLERLYKYNNPWESSKKRTEWLGDLKIPEVSQADICYFVGCTTSIDTRAQDIAKALVRILTRAGVNFGILGKEEPCCGDIAKRAGEQGLFEEQVERTLGVFSKHSISEVVTSSPHCFNLMKNEYPERAFRVRHYSQLLEELLDQGAIRLTKPMNLRVTYHDPCYLGRYNRIFDPPRRLIKSIPGIELVEMAHYGPNSLCCGGGGARMWQELEEEKKISHLRIKEAEETGASVMVTACPYCLIMLEDALKSTELDQKLRVMDLNELLLEAL